MTRFGTLCEMVAAAGSHVVGAYCHASSNPAPDGGGAVAGQAVFDGAGKVVCATGLREQQLVTSAASYRWPCYADQALPNNSGCSLSFGGNPEIPQRHHHGNRESLGKAGRTSTPVDGDAWRTRR
jgi:hypothetical protein